MTAAPATSLDPASAAFEANCEAMVARLSELLDLHRRLLDGGGVEAVARHRARGKLMVRERIHALLDAGSPFLELSALAGWGTDDPLGAALVTGIGIVEGVECVVSANDPTVRGGTSSPSSIRKALRAQEIALTNRLPLVNLTESGGADLPKQADVFVPGGATFRNLSRLSAAGIPTVTAVFGSSTAGGAYVPGMSDHTILVDGAATVYLGGPPLVKMAIDEDIDDEALGGATMHATVSGLADEVAADELHAVALARRAVRRANWRKAGPGPTGAARPPLLSPEELLGVVPADLRQPFDMREVIWRITDESAFDEHKASYGPQLVCGWAEICGFPVGILANNGVLFSAESQKGAQFVQLCNRRDLPILFLQNITGFMVGSRAERGGIIKHGAMLIHTVSNSTVPHLTLMIGASYGAGNYGMSGRAYDPRFVFSWPSHRIAVMGGAQLAGVLALVRAAKADRAGAALDEASEAAARDAVEAQIEAESGALFATGRGWDDGIIDPRDTRTVLGIALSATHGAPVRGTTAFGVFRP